MRHFTAFCILALVKTLSHLFYRQEFHWLNEHPRDVWEKARLIALLNHTSLYEPLFIQGWSMLICGRSQTIFQCRVPISH
jgi:hypothetical protein